MREFLTYGSVRGAAGNGGPYRDQTVALNQPTDACRNRAAWFVRIGW